MKTTISMYDDETGAMLADVSVEDLEMVKDSDTLYHTIMFKAILKGYLPQAYKAFEDNLEEVMGKLEEDNLEAVVEELDKEEATLDA